MLLLAVADAYGWAAGRELHRRVAIEVRCSPKPRPQPSAKVPPPPPYQPDPKLITYIEGQRPDYSTRRPPR